MERRGGRSTGQAHLRRDDFIRAGGIQRAKARFAVCWNGLVYQTVAVGSRASLDDDISALVRADEAMRAKYMKGRPSSPFYRFRHAWAEGSSVSHQSLLPIKACLLLRLGEVESARSLWTAWTAGMRENTNDDRVHLKDPYLMLATDWTWAQFDRAVCAHMRGDDRLALLDARALTLSASAVETECARRGFEKRNDYSDSRLRDRKLPYLAFLQPLPALLADQERRDRERLRPRPLPANALASPDKATRIAALIENLDEAAARQDSQPGGVSMGDAEIVQSLVKEGEDAVGPLLAALKTDRRLTRSVSFGRNFFHGRRLISTGEAGYAALRSILRMSFEGMSFQDIQAYWEKFRNVPPEERWYRTLADDTLPPAQWLHTAFVIAQPTNVTGTPNVMTIKPLKPGEAAPLRGEKLRTKQNLSVAELMARRAESLVQIVEHSSSDIFRLMDACRIALYLSKWDAKAALPTLQAQMARCRVALSDKANANSSHTQGLSYFIARLTLARARGGDANALNEYEQWLRSADLQEMGFGAKDIFRPLWRHAGDPAMARAADWLFNDAASLWSRLLRPETEYFFRDLLRSPMTPTAGFKKHLLRELSNPAKAGTAQIHAGTEDASYRSISARVEGGFSTGGQLQPDALMPPPGSKHDFRVCDLYAWALYVFRDAPRCELYWPQDKRALAIAACIQWLERGDIKAVDDPFAVFAVFDAADD